MFDILSFLIKPLDDHGPEVLTLTSAINDVRLTDLIEHFERECGMEPAGGYGGFVPAFFRYGRLDHYFLGEPNDEHFQKKGEYYLLVCQFGEVGCWPLSARITTTDTSVVWDRFAQEHSRERDYSGFGPFTFELSTYQKTIRELAGSFPTET